MRIWIACVLAACGDNTPAVVDPLAIATLVDINPDPKIVEVQLVASVGTTAYLPGHPAELWGYRDGSVPGSRPSVPGPLLDVNQGDHVIVHFRNELAETTTVHWHGIRVPNASDGSDHTQAPVEPGASFDYEFDVADASTFWYHPHVRGDVQVEKGLYGPIVVRGGVVPAVDADRVLVLDDIKLAADGSLDNSVDMQDIDLGRQGNTLLVNGAVGPVMHAKAGARERWRFIDAANGRFFKLALPGHPFLVIGWDGGLLAEPYTTDTLLIAPGERYEVIVTLDGARDDALVLQTQFYARAMNLPDPGTLDLMTIKLDGPAAALPDLPTTWASFEPIATDASTPTRNFLLYEIMMDGHMIFSINGEQYPTVTPIHATRDTVEIWTIHDDVGMDHPFHLHGNFFQVLDIDGVPVAHAGWKDTAVVPMYTHMHFAVRHGAPGHWMYHCHILEHQEGGMMGVLIVDPAP